jgi:1,2-diacylglycerol 3-beta-glucosyltransferase
VAGAILLLFVLPLAVVWVLPLLAECAPFLGRGRPPRGGQNLNVVRRERLLFLVPAHNEDKYISGCIESLRSMDAENCEFDLVVVADNCTDSTAEAASAAGANVFERTDPERRGKPQAIGWALEKIAFEEYDAVVIVDADSVVDQRFAYQIVRCGPLRNKSLQTYNGIANPAQSWLTLLGNLLVLVRYEGQFLRKKRLGLNCPLSNGIVLGSSLIRKHGWPGESLTENWELFARYTAAGEWIDYNPLARLWSIESSTVSESTTRRRRWQLGRFDVLKRYGQRIIVSRKIDWIQKLDAIADIASPGPVVHFTLGSVTALVLFLIGTTLSIALATLFLASVIPSVFWTTRLAARQPNRIALVSALVRLPLYAVWRIAVVGMTIVTATDRVWRRSPRP